MACTEHLYRTSTSAPDWNTGYSNTDELTHKTEGQNVCAFLTDYFYLNLESAYHLSGTVSKTKGKHLK